MPVQQPARSASIPRRISFLAISSALLVLAGTILFARHQLGLRVREQILARDAVVLHEVMLLPQPESDPLSSDSSLNDPANQVTALLRTSRLRGVLAARLLDASGHFVQGFPINAQEANLAPHLLPKLQALEPISVFHPQLPLSSFLWMLDSQEASHDVLTPILEVNVPLHALHNPQLKGIAQFMIDGHGVAAEFAQLENHLNTQALIAFGVSGTILTLSVGYALRRLRHANLLLEQRTRDLLQANQELLLAAKTSAIGAVTSHLLHGLRNPLAGLQSWVHSLSRRKELPPLEDWHEAVATTRRMQSMIQDIVQVLRSEEQPSSEALDCSELLDSISAQVRPLCQSRNVDLKIASSIDQQLNARTAHLARLILVNLTENAIQASPAISTVHVQARQTKASLEFTVSDHGPGLSPAAMASLFQPASTHREGGAGIGLAISKQLANHLGASLELVSSTPQGSQFLLRLPLHAAIPGTYQPSESLSISGSDSTTNALAD